MTPADFARVYGALAARVAHDHPHLFPRLILAQWGIETGWGSSSLAVNHHNLAGIRWYGRAAQVEHLGGTPGKAGTGFAGYASFDTFAADYGYVIGLPYYNAVRAATDIYAQARALGASPWDAGHYLAGGVAGGSIIRAINLIPSSVPVPPPAPHGPSPRVYTVARGDTLWAIAARYYGRGTAYPRIAVANRFRAPYIIHVGERLVIP